VYWLLDYEKQEEVRQKIIKLQTNLPALHQRNQREQVFPFVGRKDRNIARIIVEHLTDDNALVCDPFGGSGTFAYAALDAGRNITVNEWEPYAFRLSRAPFHKLPNQALYLREKEKFIDLVKPVMETIYKTCCPTCGREFMFNGLFFDREPEEYYHPTPQERMGPNNENVIFRSRKYRCICGVKEKFFDDFDYAVKIHVDSIPVDFPNERIIENSRLNFTATEFTQYANLFSHRQKVALITLRDCIAGLSSDVRSLFEDTFLSIIHLGKYHDYRSKSQDNHCPPNRLKEPNLYHCFVEKLEERKSYIAEQNFDLSKVKVSCADFRDYLHTIEAGSVDLLLTDPPYGDSAQYFEHAQRVHPFMGYNLSDDIERLKKEVVVSDAPSRPEKNKEHFLKDIESFFAKCAHATKTHGYMVLYFRPEQNDWISDLNKLKDFARRHAFEPIITIPLNNQDPSMRVLASAAWTFSKDICFVFLKLADNERRWYEGDFDVDEIVYQAALTASEGRGLPFTLEQFNGAYRNKAAAKGLMKLLGPSYQDRVIMTLNRFCAKEYAQYRLTDLSPYSRLHSEMNAEIRLREFAPVVIEELSVNSNGFTFEEYVVHLSAYMDNGSKQIIDSLHRANRLIPELLLQYATENETQGKFFVKDSQADCVDLFKINIRTMDPVVFEHLIADYFKKRGYIETKVIGRSCDRGVDILATNLEGELELIQCKRYRKGSNIGSTPIQRVDSYMRSRGAKKAWVVTTSDFTPEGYDEARITGVITINGNELVKSLDMYYPGKYRL